jgi:hypothetical protein
VLHEDAGLLERAGIEEEIDPLAGREAALGVQLRDPLLAASLEDGLAAPAQLFDRGASGQAKRSKLVSVLGKPGNRDGTESGGRGAIGAMAASEGARHGPVHPYSAPWYSRTVEKRPAEW